MIFVAVGPLMDLSAKDPAVTEQGEQ